MKTCEKCISPKCCYKSLKGLGLGSYVTDPVEKFCLKLCGPHLKQLTRRYKSLIKGAETRGIPIAIDIKDYFFLRAEKCSYCQSYIGVKNGGLDRINSNKGYTKSNCVPCCGDCNWIKGARKINQLIDKLPKILKGLKKIQQRRAA